MKDFDGAYTSYKAGRILTQNFDSFGAEAANNRCIILHVPAFKHETPRMIISETLRILNFLSAEP